MAPPSSSPTLQGLALEPLVREAVEAVAEHLGSLGGAYVPGEGFGPSLVAVAAESTSVGLAVLLGELLAYAQDGDQPLGSLGATLERVATLYDGPLGDVRTPAELWDSDGTVVPDDLHGRLSVLARACWAREALDLRRPVRLSWLAALAGLSLVAVRKAVEAGDLERAGRGHATPESSVRWLAARGVQGVEALKPARAKRSKVP